MRKFLSKFTAFDLCIIAIMAALGVAAKPLVTGLVHIISGPLFIPAGSIAGGIYMMWIVLGAGICRKRGVATLIGVVQAILVIVTGVYGTHGVVSFLTYSVPGLAVDLFLLLSRLDSRDKLAMFIGGIISNLCGVILTNAVFFRLPAFPLIVCICVGALSGALGGLLSYLIASRFKKIRI